MKEIKVQDLRRCLNIICLLLGRSIIFNSAMTHHRIGETEVKGCSVEHYSFLTEDPAENAEVIFFIYKEKENAEVIVKVYGEQYNIFVEEFPEHGFINMDILDCFFNVLKEEDIKEALDFIYSSSNYVSEGE